MCCHMNRIRHLRKLKSWSAADLAARVGTTQPTIQRLEKGQQALTVEWMQRIAKALSVTPADLLETALVAGLETELEPVPLSNDPEAQRALFQRGLKRFRVTGESLISLGVRPGASYLFDTSAARLKAVRTGDIVAAEAIDFETMATPALIVRQFMAPGLLTTNKPGRNAAFSIGDDSVQARIVGVMEPPTPAADGDPAL